MSDDERVATLAVAFARQVAPAILSRLTPSSSAEALRYADRLAAATRRERLLHVASALQRDVASARERAGSAAARERPRIAGLLVRIAAGHPPEDACMPALARLCRERIGG